MKTAWITGVRGQDGSYLAQHLLTLGYAVVGTGRPGGDSWRLKELGIEERVQIETLDSEADFLNRHRPDEIYNLSAQSVVARSIAEPAETFGANLVSPLAVLDAIVQQDLPSRFFQASSSEIFGDAAETPQTETTAFRPRNPYGVTKTSAHKLVQFYRQQHRVFACKGILYNHESPLRSPDFVTRKITMQVAEIEAGRRECLELGNVDARRDWGFAGDYVVAMHAMLQMEQPEDLILATGTTRSVRDFVTAAFGAIGVELEWAGSGLQTTARNADGTEMVRVNPAYYREEAGAVLCGNPARAQEILGWKASMSLENLLETMIAADRRRLQDQRAN